jgi:hypothetical protein
MRKPNRTPVEKVEDAFYDLSLDDQASVLVWLAKAHEICRRERAKVADPPLEETTVTCPACAGKPLEVNGKVVPLATCTRCGGEGRIALKVSA